MWPDEFTILSKIVNSRGKMVYRPKRVTLKDIVELYELLDNSLAVGPDIEEVSRTYLYDWFLS